MSDDSGWRAAFQAMLSVGWGVGLLCQVAIIAVIASVVRRHRPDAWGALLAWAMVGSGSWLLRPVLDVFVFRFVSPHEKALFVGQLIAIPLHVLAVALLLRGLVRVAQPPPKVDLGPQPPYR